MADKDLRSVETSYTAKDLSVLEGLDAVRKRPGMYIGSTDGRGLMHCLWEIIDNAVDEALAGFCKKIIINLEKDGSIEVHDDGRGIPVDKEPKTGLTGVEVVMTKLHAGGKFGGGSYAATGGLHGVGASVVNALASRLDVEVDRDGKIYWMSFKRGVAGVFEGDGPNATFEPQSGLRTIGKVSAKITGTRVKWWADKQIFIKDSQYDIEEIYTRARQTSYLVPGLTLEVNDNRTKEKKSETFFHKGGISEYCTYIQSDAPVGDVIRLHAHHWACFRLAIALQHRQAERDEKRCQVRIKPRAAGHQGAQGATEARAHFLAHQFFKQRIFNAAEQAKRGTRHALLPA